MAHLSNSGTSGPCQPAKPRTATVSSILDGPPCRLFGLILQAGLWHQVGLAVLSGLVFALGVAPLEVQRRIVNGVLTGESGTFVLLLAGLYAALALGEGL